MIASLKFIQNSSNIDLVFDNFILFSSTSGTSGNDGNILSIHNDLLTNNNFVLINKFFFTGKLNIWDEDNNQIINNQEFDNIWSFWRRVFAQKQANPNYFKIYDYLSHDAILGQRYDFSLAPKSVDYIKDVTIRFARKETFTRGFLTNVEYFESSTTGANGVMYFTNPILNVNMKYYVNSIGYVSYRETTRKWQKVDNSYATDTKVTVKQYNGVMSREEAIQRRNNIINQLILDIVNITYVNYYPTKTMDEIELMVLPLLDALENDVNKYIKGNLQPLIVNVSNASNVTYPWLDIIVEGSTTLHDYIENKLLEAILAEGMYTSTEPS